MFRKGQHIGHYTLLEKLGQGGFGAVWRAENHTEPVAAQIAITLPRSDQIEGQAI